MSDYIPVEGNSGLYRDSESTAIINKDKKAYLAYMERKKSVQNKNLELDQMKQDIDNVKGELGEIKEQRLAAGNGKDTPDKPRDKRPPMKAEKLRVQKEKMADKFRLKERKLRGLKND